MKRYWHLFAVLLLIIMISGCAAQPSSEEVPTINATGYGTITTEPDTVEIRLSVITEGKTKNVQEENAAKTNSTIEALLALGLTKDELETQNVNFYPLQRWDKNLGNQTIGYRAENTLLVKTKKTDLAGTITDTAIKNGAETVGSLNFTLSDEGKEKLLGEAMEKAVLDARKQADAAAAAAGVKIIGIKNISISKASQSPIIYMRAKESADAAAPETPVIPEDTEYTITVQASFIID